METNISINYNTSWGENVAIVIGSTIHPMTWTGNGNWMITLNLNKGELDKYIYIIVKDGVIVRNEWECHSRKIITREIKDNWNECPIPGCKFRYKHQNPKFDQPGFRGAGTAIPIFSLRSNTDFGIGEFKDLHYLIEWAEKTGQCIIQLLPINDTTRKGGWEDSYPYNPVSIYALNPMYINLQDIGVSEDSTFISKQKELNSNPDLDYPKVYVEKMKYLKDTFKKNEEKDSSTDEYQKFKENNDFWLADYSKFAGKRDDVEPEFHVWLQYHLDKQLFKEVCFAREKGISLKGDLPIGVSADSSDAYYSPELFNLDSTAGAPPDYFSADGQNWGFPTYNWEEMAKDNYSWWRRRLQVMSRYFDAYRIDHILGFFRIWEIPVEYKGGMLGHFNPALPYSPFEIVSKGLPIRQLFHEDPRKRGMYQPYISPDLDGLTEQQKSTFNQLHHDFFFHRHNEFWRQNAESKLPSLLSATGMLACGEDLGMIPDCVPDVMYTHRILSLMVRGMVDETHWSELSVAATSSHDMCTLRMQFDADPSAETIVGELGRFLHSPSMLAIFPLQDWIAIDDLNRRKERNEERINEPGNPNHHWKYRFHLPIEELVSEKFNKMNQTIINMINASNRKQIAQ